ncbi:Transcription initiation factor IIB [Grifola frondosa]|uniref:Transcription initiation factor IIB n=1 Tax=Grifola frondosa TaxID=5627 RepID=A0A1C7MF30_GRIFR|nr:Transcription initiation factor IIB [Grifola frondosa]
MNARCEECGEPTIWDQDLGSAICTQCGTLADPSQSVLTSHLETTDTSGRDFSFWSTVQGGSTLRGRNGWALAGQGKEARDRKNTIAMHEFIRSVATQLSSPGLTPRAQGIFDQAMSRGRYRWGRKAKRAAGAAVAIALRETHKSDSLRDIAYLLDQSPISLARSFTAIVELLQLNLASADPSVHLPRLQTHLLSLIRSSSTDGGSNLPKQLLTALTPLTPRLPTIIRTATSLAALLARTSALSNLPTPPTACALLILALEAEHASSLPHAGTLAQALGARVGAGKGVVMQRYKIVYDLVEEWIREVPWLEGHERKKGKGGKGEGRSKVAKRVVVARGLKDVVQFQEEIWRKKTEAQTRPQLELELDEREDDDSAEESESEGGSSGTNVKTTDLEGSRKKPKIRHNRSVAQASCFLLNPLSAAASSSEADAPDLLTHLLTADASSLMHAFTLAPTRLQLLAASRGGELDGLVRSADEVEAVRVAMAWDATSESQDAGKTQKVRKRKRREVDDAERAEQVSSATVREKGKGGVKGTKRINMDALAKLLDPTTTLDEDDADENSEDDHGEGGSFTFVEGGEIVEEWRPPSPGGGGFNEDWYDL